MIFYKENKSGKQISEHRDDLVKMQLELHVPIFDENK